MGFNEAQFIQLFLWFRFTYTLNPSKVLKKIQWLYAKSLNRDKVNLVCWYVMHAEVAFSKVLTETQTIFAIEEVSQKFTFLEVIYCR